MNTTLTPITRAPESELLSLAGLLTNLFACLDREEVRYCLLHPWAGLPEQMEGERDLDIAIEPRDADKLPVVFRALSDLGYRPIQALNYEVNSFAYVFVWFEGRQLKAATLDFAFEHRERSMRWMTGGSMVAGRRRTGPCWSAHPAVEFRYLLVKKVANGRLRESSTQRLRSLVVDLGTAQAESIARELFGRKRAGAVVQACLEGIFQALLPELRPALMRRYVAARPLRAVVCMMEDFARKVRRWMRPTGLCIMLLGPDGVGKSTLIAGLNAVLDPVFRRHRLFHWRPGLALPIRDGDDSLGSPHAQPSRAPAVSICFLLGFFLDFCLGYAVHVRPLLARSGLIIFDRYFPDLMVDRRRYRYSGPGWLVKALWAMLPKSDDLALILNAKESEILARKQQLGAEELGRQLAAYRGLVGVLANAHVVETGGGIERTLAAASEIVIRHLARRFDDRHRFKQTSGTVCLPESGA